MLPYRDENVAPADAGYTGRKSARGADREAIRSQHAAAPRRKMLDKRSALHSQRKIEQRRAGV